MWRKLDITSLIFEGKKWRKVQDLYLTHSCFLEHKSSSFGDVMNTNAYKIKLHIQQNLEFFFIFVEFGGSLD